MPDQLTPEDLAAMKRRCEAATKGPWAWLSYGEKCYAFAVVTATQDEKHHYEQVGGLLVSGGSSEFCLTDERGREVMVDENICESERQEGRANCQFIAHARDDMPRLVAEVERLRAALETIRRDHGQVCAEFETCDHPACNASYAAWAIADAALAAKENEHA